MKKRKRPCGKLQLNLPTKDPFGFEKRFQEMSVDELIECFNNEVGNKSWTTARGYYLVAWYN